MDTEPSSDPYRVWPGWVRVHRDTLRVLLQVIVIGTGALGLWLIGTGPQSDELPPPTPAALSFAPSPEAPPEAPQEALPELSQESSHASLPSAAVPTTVHSPRSAGAGRQEAGSQEAEGQGPRPTKRGGAGAEEHKAGEEAGGQEAEVRAVVEQGAEAQDGSAPAGGEALPLAPSTEDAPVLPAQPLSGVLPGLFASILPTPAPSPTVLVPPETTGQWVWPVRGELSQGYSDAHRAIDISTEQGAVIVAADAGTVVYARWESSGYGYLVIVDHHNGFVSYYGHLYGFYVDAGHTVARGEQIGELGTTGRSTGPHLHFEIRQDGVPRNPLDLLP